jgi:hypothetical protein
MKNRVAFSAVWACGIYLTIYGVLYYLRGSAANLSYWVYSERTPDWVECSLYYGFYPAYIVHQRCFGGQRHIYDWVLAYTWSLDDS